MENFIVSALKYRPDSFERVVGQNSITKTLENAILQNKIPQAMLFCGPRGVGKTTCARILAKQINNGAQPFIKVPDNIIDGNVIAEMEFREKKIPFIIVRPIPNGKKEYWKLRDLEIVSY